MPVPLPSDAEVVGHLSADGRVVRRMADAMRRGALCHDRRTGSSSVDFMAVDWFELAGLPIEEARRMFGLVAKSAGAIADGSVGPWEPGGISPFRQRSGRAAAESAGVAFDSFGAEPGPPPAGPVEVGTPSPTSTPAG